MPTDLSGAQYLLLPLGLRALLALLFLYLHRRKQQPYLLYWAVAWTFLALGSLAHLFLATQPGAPGLLPHLDSLLLAFASLLFLDSARVYDRGTVSPGVTAYLAPVFVAWLVLRLALIEAMQNFPLEYGSALALAAAGLVFWRTARRREIIGTTLLATAFLLWGAATGLTPVLVWVRGWLGALTPFLLDLPWLAAAFGQFIVLYEEERRSLERQMLGMVGMNLISSTARQATTVEETVEQALERLLTGLRVPTGVIAYKLDHSGAPPRCVHRGQGSFLHEVERADLLPYLQHTVARLGGLLVFPDLGAEAAPAAFKHQPDFRQLVQLARKESTRLLLGVSLRVKGGDRGVLLLASPQLQRFTPAELRLLLGLGGQLGLALENYDLMQQAARRTEELRLLNDIGRALGSVRNLDELLERVHAELRRVLEVDNFYIALYDADKDEVCFELEFRHGSRLSKQRRRAGRWLTEHVLAGKEPVLIASDFAGALAGWGVTSERPAKSYCAAPILLQGEALGVIALLNYETENAFDAEHVNVLAALAGQAAVAIENARLFGAERKRTRQLDLLNSVSRQAVTTLNPDEILQAMATEIHSGLDYDYVGLGVLDYASREVVMQAEGATGVRGLNRRFKLDEGSVGKVAVSGELRRVDDLLAAETSADVQPVLPDAGSLVTLPLMYSDQLLGVLHVESRQPFAFDQEDLLLLRTVADQVGSALHNAFVFQRAQEQAITDGLTGVKTHRFFMEALNTEWRRATRVSRNFSLLLLDLDKFKFVNDYFGHLEGDTILQRVGRILEQNVRRSDVVARYGGDEFVALMPETNSEQAFLLGDKIRQLLAGDPLLQERKITASIGLGTYPQHATTPQELIQIADASMYLAKHQGGNVIISADHYKESEQKQWQRHVLEAYLGVTIKRLFSTGPEAFTQIYRRLEQVADSLGPATEWQQVPAPVLETVTSLAFAIDAKNHYTQGHSDSVARYCLQVATQLKLPQADIDELRLAAILHDVGKIGVPERLLTKPAALDGEEFEQMKQHSDLGGRLLEPLRCLGRVQTIIRHHHERWDGSGYPDHLKGEDIPLASRLIAIADAYDTIVSERTYKRASSRDDAFRELRRCAGTQFDPKLIGLFLEAMGARTEPAGERPPVART